MSAPQRQAQSGRPKKKRPAITSSWVHMWWSHARGKKKKRKKQEWFPDQWNQQLKLTAVGCSGPTGPLEKETMKCSHENCRAAPSADQDETSEFSFLGKSLEGVCRKDSPKKPTDVFGWWVIRFRWLCAPGITTTKSLVCSFSRLRSLEIKIHRNVTTRNEV